MTEHWQVELRKLRVLEPPDRLSGRPASLLAHEQEGNRSRTLLQVAAFAGLALMVVGALVLHVAVGDSGAPDSRVADIGAAGPIGGEMTTLQGAAQIVPFTIYRPQDPIASDSSVSRVIAWAPDQNTQAAVRIEYSSGVVATLTQWPDGKDPATSYERQWQQVDGLGTLTTISGHPAWVLPGNAKPSLNPVNAPGDLTSGVTDPSQNAVELTVGDVDIVLRGSVSVDSLVRAAGTIQVG